VENTQNGQSARQELMNPNCSDTSEQLAEPSTETESPPVSQTSCTYGDGPEFSSDAMPAAFSACVFLVLALVICVLIAVVL
jgi:hypothetical protein